MNKFYFFVIFSAFFGLCTAKKLPNTVKICSESDPQINECIKKQANEMIPTIQHGSKKLRIPDLAPFIVDEVKTSIGRLDLHLTNLKIYGIDQAHVENVEYNKEAETLKLEISFPEIKLKSTYSMNGQILILPVEGNGPMKIILNKPTFEATLHFSNLRRDSTKNIEFLSSILDYKVKSISMNFENLFNGNKQLADPINRILNEEQESIHKDFKPIFIETINSVLNNIIRQFFQGYHYRDLFKP